MKIYPLQEPFREIDRFTYPGVSVPILLSRAAEAIHSLQSNIFERIGIELTIAEYSVVSGLMLHERASIRELSELCRIDRKNLFRLLGKLENLRLICREECATDRRVQVICLSNRGVKLFHLVEADMKALSNDLFGEMTSEEILSLCQSLAKISEQTRAIQSAKGPRPL